MTCMYCSEEMYFCCGQLYSDSCICSDVKRQTKEFDPTNCKLHQGISNHIRKLWPDLCDRISAHFKTSFDFLSSREGDNIERDLALIQHRQADRRLGIKYAEIKIRA